MLLSLLLIASLWVSSLSCLSVPGVYQIFGPVDHTETPTWDNRTGLLYFVNIHEGEIYSYDYVNEHYAMVKLPGETAIIIPSKDDPNLLIVGLDRSILAVEWDQKSGQVRNKILSTVSNQFPTSRFNDGKADKQGRLWLGTMGYEGPDGLTPNEGVLYKVTCNNLNDPSVEIGPVNISNGMAWSKDNKFFYYIDTPTGTVVEYSFDEENGDINNRRIAFDVSLHHDSLAGSPDGMTIDEDDNLWVALYGGGAVVKVDPKTGDVLQVVAIPAEDVTSAMWGGPDLDVLFVTTSRYSLSDEQRRQQPAAGSVFAVTGLGTKGLPMFEADLISSIDDETCNVNWNN